MRFNRFLLAAPLVLWPALLAAQAPSEVVPAPATSLPLKHAPQSTTAAITVADLMTRLYIVADDSMMGREAGTLGNVKGTDYIAAEAKRMGLVPAGDDGGYFQALPYKTRAVSASSIVAIGTANLSYRSEWVVSLGVPPSGTFPIVFGGTLGDDSPRIDAAQAAGKLVVYRVVLPRGMAMIRDSSAFPAGAATLGFVGLDPFMAGFAQPISFVDDKQPQRTTRLPILTFALSTLAKMFDGNASALEAGMAGHAATLNVTITTEPVAFPTRNVLASLPGSDAKLKGEYVAVGAHSDHIGFNHRPVDHDSIRIYNHIARPAGAEDGGKEATAAQQTEINAQLAVWRSAHPNTARADSIANGADDDGSGSVALLEIAEHFAALPAKPKRSLLFVWHVGEEKGLLGSAFFTDHQPCRATRSWPS